MFKQTPPMGWNSWNTFGKDINEQVIRETADAMVDRGFLAAGYEYIVIDDCWSLRERDKDGHIVADPEKFPSGMKALADYVHSKGLKFGMYSCDGPKTCAGYPGSFDHEFLDAHDFAEIGIDYLKYDNCYRPSYMPARVLYNRMSMALKSTGRDILFSACNWGEENVENWIRSTGAGLYRSTSDIYDSLGSFSEILFSQLEKMGSVGPGCFNDLDMLICGMHGKGNVAEGEHQGCTKEQYALHFALWAFMASPLMLGCDVRTVDDETVKMLTNPELIKINQDIEARPPFVIHSYPGHVMLLRHLANDEYAFGLFVFSDWERELVTEFAETGLSPSCGYGFHFKDIITGEDIGIVTDDVYLKNIPPFSYKIWRGKIEKA